MTKEFCRSIELFMHRRARQPTVHEFFFHVKYFTIVTNPNQKSVEITTLRHNYSRITILHTIRIKIKLPKKINETVSTVPLKVGLH